MLCDDGGYYIVKFQNNPQGTRILANEMLGTKLAALLGLPVAEPQIINVEDRLILETPDLHFDMPEERVKCAGGLHFGSRYVCDPFLVRAFDFLPDQFIRDCENIESFCGMLVFDLWTCNRDCRQVIFHAANLPSIFRRHSGSGYIATMVDQGYCFNVDIWSFPVCRVGSPYPRRVVYEEVSNFTSFGPFLDRVMALRSDELMSIVESIPREWYGGDDAGIRFVVKQLLHTRSSIVRLISNCIASAPRHFPNWRQNTRRTAKTSINQVRRPCSPA